MGKKAVQPKIKWWRLEEQEIREIFKEAVLRSFRLVEDVNTWWTGNSAMILKIVKELLGKTFGREIPNKKESWWWNPNTQDKIKKKKEAGVAYDRNQSEENRIAWRTTVEKYRKKQKGLHLLFIDLEKACDRVPRQEVWRCLREKRVSEKYVRVMKDMYAEATTQVSSTVGTTAKFKVKVGLHQGSAFSPYVFDIVMDVITSEVREEAPGCTMFADDILLTDLTREGDQLKLGRRREELESRNLKISRIKTEYM
ncbi:uncharacterized protein LOC135215739 [Macrobrachium nipponense]|uniref:uncharacterized protein LOC135215739 n=1 Tax=Macrobrachium nipponense TaxID=159736 RepID=UPI0030C8421D